jgi:signal transduction histidine kinase
MFINSIRRNILALNKRFYIRTLQQKFFLYFTGIVLIIVLIVSAAVFYFQKQTLFQQAEEKAFSLTRTLAYASLTAVLTEDYSVVQMLIDSMMDGADIISIAILDTTGEVIASNRPEMRGMQYNDPLTVKALSSETRILQKLPSQDNQEIWDTAVPIMHLNTRIGTARIKFSVEDTYRGLFQTILGIGLAAILISLLLSYQFSRSISKPIHEAVNLASEYGKGNLEAKIQLNMDRQDEIGHLVNSLNKLSQELKTLIDEKIANEGMIMIGEFASFIIHDLKNPLSGIHLLADGLHRKISEDSPFKKYSREILLATQKLEDFIARTLNIARWTHIDKKPVIINELIENAINEVRFTSIPIIKKYDARIPEIQGDYKILLMAVKNLLTNAAESIVENGEITVETKWNGNAIIKISDTGIGIPKNRLATIFRPFFSLKTQGHGLGLAMVKKAVILHQGKIDVQSEKGVGSTFILTLPIR